MTASAPAQMVDARDPGEPMPKLKVRDESAKLAIGIRKQLDDIVLERGAIVEVFVQGEFVERRVTVPVGLDDPTVSVEVPPGPYLVRARLPNGERLAAQGIAQAGDYIPVILEAAHSRHEYLQWASFAVNLPQLRRHPREGELPSELLLGRPIWFRLFSGEVVTPAAMHIEKDESACLIQIRPFTLEGAFAQVGRDGESPLIVALPGHWTALTTDASVELLIANGGHQLLPNVVIRDRDFAPVLAYAAADESDAIELLSPELLHLADYYFRDKLRNPFPATIAAYAFLRARETRRRPDWLRNLTNWFEWLPDGPVILGWHYLLEQDLMNARVCFLAAAARGVPFLSQGVRLLSDGLRIVTSRWRAGQPRGSMYEGHPFPVPFAVPATSLDAARKAMDDSGRSLLWAQERIDLYAGALMRTSFWSTFHGHSPHEPEWQAKPVAVPSDATVLNPGRR